MANCDFYYALRSKLPYKLAFDHEKAIQIITEGDHRTKPARFDPNVLSAFNDEGASFAPYYASQTLLLSAGLPEA